MKKILLYGHGTILNHGSEAILTTFITLIRKNIPDAFVMVATHFLEEDLAWSMDVDLWLGCNKEAATNELYYKDIDAVEIYLRKVSSGKNG